MSRRRAGRGQKRARKAAVQSISSIHVNDKQEKREEKVEEVEECAPEQTESHSCSAEGLSYECSICLDDIDPDEVVQNPCGCVGYHYCKKCYNEHLVNDPRCPTCRQSIGFDYDLDKGEAKFLLYNKEESAVKGMIMLPETNKPWNKLSRASRVVMINEMNKRSRPAFLKMLRSEPTGEHGARRCVCGGKNCFRRFPVDEIRNQARNPKGWCATCDACGADLWQKDENGKCVRDEEGKVALTETHIWLCERGTKAVVHLLGLSVCDDCMSGKKAVPEDVPLSLVYH